jgi:hypothetical protein
MNAILGENESTKLNEIIQSIDWSVRKNKNKSIKKAAS